MKHYLFLLVLLCSATTHISCADETAPKVKKIYFGIGEHNLDNYLTIVNLIEKNHTNPQTLEGCLNDFVENPLTQGVLYTLITVHGIHNPESAESMLQLFPKTSPLYLTLLARVIDNYSNQNKFKKALDLIHTSECIMMEDTFMLDVAKYNANLHNLHASIYWLEKYNTIDPLGETNQKALDVLYKNIPILTFISKKDEGPELKSHNSGEFKNTIAGILQFENQDLYNPAMLESIVMANDTLAINVSLSRDGILIHSMHGILKAHSLTSLLHK